MRRMDRIVEGYWLTRLYEEFHIPIEQPAVHLAERPLSRADELVLQAELCVGAWPQSKRNRVCARQAIADALAEDPLHLRASELHIMMSMADPAKALIESKALMKRHPDQWLPAALTMFAAAAAHEALPSGGEYDPGRAVALAPWQTIRLACSGLPGGVAWRARERHSFLRACPQTATRQC